MQSEALNRGDAQPQANGRVAADARGAASLRPSAQAILAQAQDGRVVLEDFVPLTDSLEFALGQQYWRERGSKAFISDATPVPFAINNDGALSRHTAEVFFASLVEAEQSSWKPGAPTCARCASIRLMSRAA